MAALLFNEGRKFPGNALTGTLGGQRKCQKIQSNSDWLASSPYGEAFLSWWKWNLLDDDIISTEWLLKGWMKMKTMRITHCGWRCHHFWAYWLWQWKQHAPQLQGKIGFPKVYWLMCLLNLENLCQSTEKELIVVQLSIKRLSMLLYFGSYLQSPFSKSWLSLSFDRNKMKMPGWFFLSKMSAAARTNLNIPILGDTNDNKHKYEKF